MTTTSEHPHPKPTRLQRLMRYDWLFAISLAFLAAWLTTCGTPVEAGAL